MSNGHLPEDVYKTWLEGEPQPIDDEQEAYEERFINELNECETSDYLCPKCDTLMKLWPEGTSRDDYTNKLICPNCFLEETE